MQRALKGERINGRFSFLSPLSGMRVKLRNLALKARHSRAQGVSPGNGIDVKPALQGRHTLCSFRPYRAGFYPIP
jgi:hypothetical protein